MNTNELSSSEPSQPLADGGRDGSSGRFKPGNRCGRGNPHAKQSAALRSAFLKVITPEKLAKILSKLVEMASHGSIPAATLILKYSIPVPPGDDAEDEPTAD